MNSREVGGQRGEGVVVARLEVIQFSKWFEMLEARASESSGTEQIGRYCMFSKTFFFYLIAETDGVFFFFFLLACYQVD